MAWSAGQRLQDGKYTIERELGLGGFGITYLARDNNGHYIVVKTLNDIVQKRSDFTKFQQDFLNEALRLARCFHSHIVRIDEVIQEEALWCIVMEYIAGVDLDSRLQKGVLPEVEALHYIQQIGKALSVVHNHGLLHRDIKPQNIMLRKNNDAVLIDFGIARQFTPDLTQRHTEHLTPGFAPIEQYFGRRKRGAYTDVYALAATLYTLLTGIIPPSALDRDYEIQTFKNDLLVPPAQVNVCISDKVDHAILTGMAVQPENRPQSMHDWLALLTGTLMIKIISKMGGTWVGNSGTRNKLNNEPPPTLPKMLGTWVGNFGSKNHPATLVITQQSGDSFDGTLIVQDSNVDGTYRIGIKGYHNSKNNKISIQEHRVLSEPWLCDWRRGENDGILSLGGKEMSGKGKDSRNSYSWSFLKVDYTNLTNLLKMRKWKEADRETGTLMIKITCREQKQKLNSEDIKNFPCQDLRTIDKLWVNHSNGRFGFSVQKLIWENVNCDWKKCGDRFGWRINNDWKNYSDLTFNLNAPSGGFPTFWGGERRKLVFGYPGCWEDFFSRVKACGL